MGGVGLRKGNGGVGTEVPGRNPAKTGVVGGLRRIRDGVDTLRSRLTTTRCGTSTNNKTIRIAMGNSRRVGTVGVGPRIVSPRRPRVLRSLLVTSLGRTVHGTSRATRHRVGGLANKLGVPKVNNVFW